MQGVSFWDSLKNDSRIPVDKLVLFRLLNFWNSMEHFVWSSKRVADRRHYSRSFCWESSRCPCLSCFWSFKRILSWISPEIGRIDSGSSSMIPFFKFLSKVLLIFLQKFLLEIPQKFFLNSDKKIQRVSCTIVPKVPSTTISEISSDIQSWIYSWIPSRASAEPSLDTLDDVSGVWLSMNPSGVLKHDEFEGLLTNWDYSLSH